MAFVAAMNNPLTKAGVKGSDVYTEAGTGDERVALFQMLVRGLEPSYIQAQVEKAFLNPATDPAVLRDYVVLAFQTRDIRGGKGERDVFYAFFHTLVKARPSALPVLLPLVLEYGCWRDLWALHADGEPTTKTAVVEFVKTAFAKDKAKADRGESVSLLGKWLPREGSAHHTLAMVFATALYPDLVSATPVGTIRGGKTHDATHDECWKAYRKGCSKLNAILKTTEVAMCGHTWASIAPGAVPGRLLAKCRKAFLNEIVPREARKGRPRRHTRTETLRHPEDAGRMACREHFITHTAKALKGEVTMKGADTVYPHELASKYLHGAHTTVDEDAMIEAQWKAIREATAAAGGLGRAVAMSDFSGSMSGTPMEVSMALGILISEITHPAFRDHIIGFDSNPSWISLVGKATLKEKVRHAEHYAQGTSTDFQAACDLILRRLVEHKVPQAEAPTDLIVLTDMGFDAACGSGPYCHVAVSKTKPWETHMEMIQNSFARAGYVAPRIVLWNLRAAYKDFHAKADKEGVVVLSGCWLMKRL